MSTFFVEKSEAKLLLLKGMKLKKLLLLTMLTKKWPSLPEIDLHGHELGDMHFFKKTTSHGHHGMDWDFGKFKKFH